MDGDAFEMMLRYRGVKYDTHRSKGTGVQWNTSPTPRPYEQVEYPSLFQNHPRTETDIKRTPLILTRHRVLTTQMQRNTRYDRYYLTKPSQAKTTLQSGTSYTQI